LKDIYLIFCNKKTFAHHNKKHGTKGIRVATQIAENTATRKYDKGYQPLNSSFTAPKVEKLTSSPIHTTHRLSVENNE
jgi:hypothetical protein